MSTAVAIDIQFSVDRAGSTRGILCGTTNLFSGWVRSADESNPVMRVEFLVDEERVGELAIDYERPDLLKVFHTSMLGFWGPILLDESHCGKTLRLAAIARDGSRMIMKSFPLDHSITDEERAFAAQYDLPDDMLRQLVVTDADPQQFVRRGQDGVKLIQSILEKNQIRLKSFKNVLDFGVGCGRVIRWWKDRAPGVAFWGTDINPALIQWCREHLNFATFGVNSLHPPTTYRDGQFDFLYAFSIFTHLSIETQKEWLQEFHRILATKAYALISVHGDTDAKHLSGESLESYRENGFVMISTNIEGQNACAVYQSREFSSRLFGQFFDMVEFIPAGRSSTSSQDLYLIRKKS